MEFKRSMKGFFYAIDVEIGHKYLSSAAVLRTISYETPTLFKSQDNKLFDMVTS